MNNETNISNQAQLDELIKENEILKNQVAILKGTQEIVQIKMKNFLAKAEEVQEIGKKTFNQNLLRLKVYELKLISYYNKVIQKYPIDEDLSNLSDFITELKKVISKDFFSREQFELFGESRELSKSAMITPESLQPNESGFDFFEAMHPEKDLAELCRELGLMTDEE